MTLSSLLWQLEREKQRSGSGSPLDRRHDLSDSDDIEKRKFKGDRFFAFVEFLWL